MLEDAGYFCVDNLPAVLLPHLVAHLRSAGYQRAAVAVDVRSGTSISALPHQVEQLRGIVSDLRLIFLDSRDDTPDRTLLRDPPAHPLADEGDLAEAISREREALEPIAALGHRIDTSDQHNSCAAGSRISWTCRRRRAHPAVPVLRLLARHSGRRRPGVRRALPAQSALRPQAAAAHRQGSAGDRLPREKIPEVGRMDHDIYNYVATWLPSYIRDNRSYLTIAIGCTWGQHRSVYFAETLARQFSSTARGW